MTQQDENSTPSLGDSLHALYHAWDKIIIDTSVDMEEKNPEAYREVINAVITDRGSVHALACALRFMRDMMRLALPEEDMKDSRILEDVESLAEMLFELNGYSVSFDIGDFSPEQISGDNLEFRKTYGDE